ncbi:MAG: response regulator [Crenarchaeota archaeon]|nr:MAG: response regulator [Thermoproteota archaeon]RDJ33850.1 MAG: response regulator [Thermoproteota archaeon]RDJ37040.1 MAG: response regulator [Thermoproteota archaeon]RDJ37425.1 MAG: response regulator [Thermoproteota archaeon]
MLILIADDNSFTRKIYADAFSKRGHTVTTTNDGNECITKFKTNWIQNRKFDAVILDYSMPQKNGDEVVKQILSTEPNQSILIISAYEAEKLKSVFHNFKDKIEIVQKGFPIEALVEKIETKSGP